jgi:ABC-type Fe3+-citrate transport system substrate-binding protein
MAAKDITWDDLTAAEKRAVLRADLRGSWQMLRGASSTPAVDRRVEAVYDKARKRIAGGK